MGFEYAPMDDCIHIKACRRVQAIGKSLHLQVPRYCSEECSAYEKFEVRKNMLSVDDAVAYARAGVDSVQSGYSGYDVYSGFDLCGEDLYAIIPGDKNEIERA